MTQLHQNELETSAARNLANLADSNLANLIAGNPTNSVGAATTEATESSADDEVEIVPPSSSNPSLGILDGATLDDVELGSEPIYIVDKRNKDAKTIVKAIRGIPIDSVPMKNLRNWAVTLQIQMKKTFRKVDVIKCIVNTKTYRERQGNSVEANTNLPAMVSPPAMSRVHINNVRFINVLARDDIKARLLGRGAQKSREQLDNGIDPDGELFGFISNIYNNTNDDSLIELKWNIHWTKEPDLARFQPINTEKAMSSFKSLSASYEIAFANWKKSGHHEGIPTKAFHDFVGSSNYLDYLHCFLQETPGLLASFKGDLPPDVFSEGNGTTPARATKKQKTGKDESLSKIANAQAKKAESLSYATHAEQYSTLELAIDKQKRQMRQCLSELKSLPEFVGMETSYVKSYIRKIQKKRKEHTDDNEVENTEELYTETQETAASGDSLDDRRILVETYLDYQISIKNKKKEMEVLRNAMAKYLENLPDE